MWPYPWTHVGTPSHLGHMDRVAATMPSQAHAGAAQEAPDIGQWEGQDVPLVRPSSCNVKGGIPSSRRYLPTYWPSFERQFMVWLQTEKLDKELWILGLMDCLTGKLRESTYNLYVERQNQGDPLTYEELYRSLKKKRFSTS